MFTVMWAAFRSSFVGLLAALRFLAYSYIVGTEHRSHSPYTMPHIYSGFPIVQHLFDRGVPDVIGYLRLEGLDVPANIQRAGELFRYNKRVFIAPPWPDIYRNDAERKQDLKTACRTFETMAAVYTELGYELVELPRCSIEDRAEYIRSSIR
ncbi:AAA family ATPase [Paenibacillus chitinolyticus]